MPTNLVCPGVAFVLLASSLAAQTTWTSFADRRGHAMARTSVGGVVMFGGESVSSPGALLGDTVELSTNNQTWTGIGGAAAAPPPTMGHAMAGAMPSGQQAYVMFGGITSSGPSSRTWRYNGNAWGDVTSGVSPLARSGHAMATNTATNTMLMFGGFDGTLTLNDVWEFAPGTDTWTQQTVAVAPIGRFGCALAFHPGSGGTNGRMYMFGGSPFRNDLWEFNPFTSTWTQLLPPASPPGRRHAAMAYLAGSDTIVLFGGLSSGGVIRNDTWSYDRWTNTWTQEAPTTVPPARYEHAVSADNTGNNLVLLGGTNVLPGSGPGSVLDETWLWSSLVGNWVRQLPSPSPRDQVAMAYDSARNRHVMFGGRVPGGGYLDETWEIDGLNWRERTPTTRPPARSEAGLVFDVTRNKTVLFGGRDSVGDRNDTWEWTASATTGSWSPVVTAQSPPATSGAQAVYDSRRGKTWVLVGSTMWAYDGSNWSQPQAPPAARTGALHAVDAYRNRLVMFGGYNGSAYLGDSWEWDGEWTQLSPNPAPATRGFGAMTYHAATQRCVLQGGSSTPVAQHVDTWTWNGSQWVLVAPLASRADQSLAYDPVRAVAVLFGGYTYSGTTHNYFDDTWEWGGSTWVLRSPATRPSARADYGLAWDVPRNRIVLFGGGNGGGALADTWTYDGTTWTQALPSSSPTLRYLPAMVFDAATGCVLLFGGNQGSASSSLNDTWLWNGSNWAQQSPANPPPNRAGCVLASVNGRTVVWGGNGWNGSSNTYRSDMWEWTGTNWVELTSITPASRFNYGAAYDPRRDRVVVFGGRTTAGGLDLNETWEWSGTWQQRFPANSPSPRSRCRLTYDEARDRMVLYGGMSGTIALQDTWEWTGTNWLQRTPAAIPPGSFTHDLTFDKVRKVAVAFGSFGTWDYGPTHPASVTLYGSGCPTSGSVPASALLGLRPLPWTGAWMGEPVELEFTNAPAGPLLFLWGLSYTQWGVVPLPVSLALLGLGPAACNLRNSADLIEVLQVAPTRYVSFPMPNSPNALGVPLYGQAAFFDFGQPGFPVVTSDGVELVIGRK